MAEFLFYPDAHPELTSFDGWARRIVSLPDKSWFALHDGVGTSNSDFGFYTTIQMYQTVVSGAWDSLYRATLLFDTSSIAASETIQVAELRIKIQNRNIEPDWPGCALVVVSSNPFLGDKGSNSDYQNLGTVPFSPPAAFTGLDVGSYHTFTLNSTGIEAIAKEGITKLGLREHAYDRANIEPIPSYLGFARINVHSAEHADIEFRPRLRIVTELAPKKGYIWIEGTGGSGGYIWVEGTPGKGGYLWIE